MLHFLQKRISQRVQPPRFGRRRGVSSTHRSSGRLRFLWAGTRALSATATLVLGLGTRYPGALSLPHLSAGAIRLLNRAKGLKQPQKPESARRSSATSWVLDSWRNGL